MRDPILVVLMTGRVAESVGILPPVRLEVSTDPRVLPLLLVFANPSVHSHGAALFEKVVPGKDGLRLLSTGNLAFFFSRTILWVPSRRPVGHRPHSLPGEGSSSPPPFEPRFRPFDSLHQGPNASSTPRSEAW